MGCRVETKGPVISQEDPLAIAESNGSTYHILYIIFIYTCSPLCRLQPTGHSFTKEHGRHEKPIPFVAELLLPNERSVLDACDDDEGVHEGGEGRPPRLQSRHPRPIPPLVLVASPSGLLQMERRGVRQHHGPRRAAQPPECGGLLRQFDGVGG